MKDVKTPPPTNAVQSEGVWQKIKRVLINACVLYTVFSVIIFLVVLLITGQTDKGTGYISSVRFYLTLLPFTLVLSLAHSLLRTNWHGAVRYSLHALLSVGGFFLIVLLPYRLSASGTPVVGVLVLWGVLYGFCMGGRGIYLSRQKKISGETKEYTSVFGKSK